MTPTSTTQRISVDDFIAIPNNPRQRDTESHLRRAKHLLNPSPVHAHVALAKLASGACWKLDGHTRSLGWERGLIERPPFLIAQVYHVDDLAQVSELYTHFDNKAAVETAADQVYGAFRSVEWQPTSAILRQGKITNALRWANGIFLGAKAPDHAMTPYDLIEEWKAELQRLDVLAPAKRRFPGPVVTAALLTWRRDRERASAFWHAYNNDAGEKIVSAGTNLLDGVEALSRLVTTTGLFGGSSTQHYILVGKTLSAYVAHAESRTLSRGLQAFDPLRFMQQKAFF